MDRGPLERQIEGVLATLGENQDETIRAIRGRDNLVFDGLAAAAEPDARPTDKWVAVVDLIFQAALEVIAIGAEGDRATLLEAETHALAAARNLDSATAALLEGDQHRFVERMREAEAAIAS